ncbi:ABC transporter substrate binding family protein [Methyloversatilis sp. RAC08]|uniref:ABC transporter substrate-binding protein n=1 Tax=Methyloversatilis sp. RAC08 TaxID=1842540 RepID=UPI00083E2B20|nr:ABC transporter substrate binding protein [Methyloversatilis sp. RAC08]AOF81003.1 ABC transporter substrate binding family protein [Methyloversatilis sp. RAC08]
MRSRFSRAARALLCAFLLLGAPAAFAASVLVLLSEPGGAYAEFADSLKAERGARGGYSIAVLSRADFSPEALEPHDLVVAVGASALRTLVQSEVKVPVLSTLVPKAAYEALVAGDARRWSAIHIDQPFSRQVALIRLALPDVRRIGVVADADTPQRLQPLREAMTGTPLQLVSASFTGEASLFSSLTQVLEQSQLFLALPDPRVHNAGTVRNLLLTSFRARIPVVGFSAAYVRAGAVMSLYSTPEQMARQATDAMIGWTRERSWPPARFPRHFTVSVNTHVARSLGLRIADAEALRDQLVQQEKSP